MADNVDSKVAANVPVATDVVTYSGDAGQNVQLVRIVQVTGAEDSKTVVDLPGDAGGLLVNLGTNNDVTVTGTVTATLAAGTAYVGKVRLTDGTNDAALNTSFADATNNTQTALTVRSFNMAFNGTTWDRLRASSAFADGESNSQIALLTEAYGVYFNGTTWDRVRGDTTNGQWVNVKASVALAVTDNAGSLTVDAPVGTPAFVRLSDGAAAITTLPVSLASVPSHAVTNAGTFAVQATPAAPAATTGGASSINNTSSDGGTALTNSYAQIKTAAGSLVGYYIYNPNATAVYVQFWNALTASVTVGTTTPLFMLVIPPGSAANLWMPGGVAFGTAMGWSATSTAGGTGAPTTALDAVCWYI